MMVLHCAEPRITPREFERLVDANGPVELAGSASARTTGVPVWIGPARIPGVRIADETCIAVPLHHGGGRP